MKLYRRTRVERGDVQWARMSDEVVDMNMARKLASLAAGVFQLSIAVAGQQTAAPASGQAPSVEVRKAMEWKRFDYSCEGEAKLTVFLREQTAKVIYKNKMYLMRQTRSADGNRYSDGQFVWWGKGNGGFLQQDQPDGNGAMVVRDCKLVEPQKAEPGVVKGTVTYLQRSALPPTAVIEVKLQDVSRADAPATVIAEQKITTEGKQVPIPFELKFDPAKIDARLRYTVSARIFVGDQLRFISDTSYPVLTEGGPSSGIEIVVKAVPAKP